MSGFSGADIANLCNEAAIFAARENKQFVESVDFERAQERIMGKSLTAAGIEKTNLLSEEERRTVAYHESGHAVISWFLAGGAPLLKVSILMKLTIVPRSKGSLGFAQYLPNENALESFDELFDMMCVILGGRCAEMHFFSQVGLLTAGHDGGAGRPAKGLPTGGEHRDEVRHERESRQHRAERRRVLKEIQVEVKLSEYLQEQIDREIQSIIARATLRTKQLILQHERHIER